MDPVELEPGADYLLAMRRQAWTLAGAMALSIGMLVVVLFMIGGDPVLTLVQAGLFVLGGWAVVWLFLREVLKPSRLRITQSHVAVLRGGALVEEVPLADVFATERALLLGAKRVVYRMADAGIPPAYDLELLRRALLSRLAAEQKVDDGQFNRIAFARQPLQVKALALGVAALMVAVMAWQVAT